MLFCLATATQAQVSRYELSNCYVPVQSYYPGYAFQRRIDSTYRDQNTLFMGDGIMGVGDSLTGPGFPIGFPFKYDGEYFDRFGISTNNYLKLGKSSEGDFTMINEQVKGEVFQNGNNNSRRNTISVFQRTLAEDSVNTYYGFYITNDGTPGNRFAEITWNEKRIAFDTYRDIFLRLIERTGQIQIAYSMDSIKYAYRIGNFPNCTVYPGCLPLTQASVGLRGNQLNNDTSNLNIMKVKKGVNTWLNVMRGQTITDFCEIDNQLLPPKVFLPSVLSTRSCPYWFKWTPPFKKEKPNTPFCYFLSRNPNYLDVNGYHRAKWVNDDKSGNTYVCGYYPTPSVDILYCYFFADGAKAVPTNIDKLHWNKALGVDSFDVYFGLTYPPKQVAKNVTDTFFVFPTTLAPNTEYYYSIVAKNSLGSSKIRVGSFTTSVLPLELYARSYTSYGDCYDFSFNTLVYKQDPKYKTTYLVPETAYTTSVKRGSTYNYATYVYINKFSFPSGQDSYLYIDWNQDGDFSDSTERYTPGTITVPANAKLGKTFIRTAWLDYASHTPVNAYGCTIHQFMITVLPPDSCASFNLSFTKTNTRCYGDSTGRISLKPSGGTAPYTYTWTDGDANQVRDNLSAGTYQVTARDAKGCDRSTPVLAIQSPFLIQVDTTAVGDSLIINVSGGTDPYSYIWTDASGSTATPTATGLPTAGTYTLSVSDASTCSVSYSGIVIPKKVTTALALREASRTLKVYPNPTQSEIHISSSHVINKVVIVDLSDKQVFSKTNITKMQTSLNISTLPAGVYLVKAFTEIGVETNQVIKQ